MIKEKTKKPSPFQGEGQGEGAVKIKTRARTLRMNSTDAERLLWQLLRNRQIGNVEFRRQHPIDSFIADFVCIEKKVIVELDGSQHAVQTEKDEKRSDYLKKQGFRILRFWNNEVLKETEEVLEKIYSCLQEQETPSP